MAWNAAEVAQYLGISAASFDDLRREQSFPHPQWARDGQQRWQPTDVRLWTTTHIEMLRQRHRSSDPDKPGLQRSM